MKYKKIEFDNNDEELQVFRFQNINDSITGEFQVFRQNSRFKNRWFIIIRTKEGVPTLINCNVDLVNKFQKITSEGLITKGDNIVIKLAKFKPTKFKNKLKVYDIFVEEK